MNETGFYVGIVRRARARIQAVVDEHGGQARLPGAVIQCDGCGHRASPDVADAEGWQPVYPPGGDRRDYCPRCSKPTLSA